MLALESAEFAYLLISMVYAKITSLIYFKLLLFKTEATVCNTTLIRADNQMIFRDSDFLIEGEVIIKRRPINCRKDSLENFAFSFNLMLRECIRTASMRKILLTLSMLSKTLVNSFGPRMLVLGPRL